MKEEEKLQANVLWIIVVAIAVIGVIVLISGSVLWGIILLVIAALVRPRRLQHLQPTRLTPTRRVASGGHAQFNARTTRCRYERVELVLSVVFGRSVRSGRLAIGKYRRVDVVGIDLAADAKTTGAVFVRACEWVEVDRDRGDSAINR